MYRIQTGVGGCWLGRTVGNDNFFPTENDRIFASHVEFPTVTPSFTFEVIYFNTISLRTSEITWKIRKKSAEFYVFKFRLKKLLFWSKFLIHTTNGRSHLLSWSEFVMLLLQWKRLCSTSKTIFYWLLMSFVSLPVIC